MLTGSGGLLNLGLEGRFMAPIGDATDPSQTGRVGCPQSSELKPEPVSDGVRPLGAGPDPVHSSTLFQIPRLIWSSGFERISPLFPHHTQTEKKKRKLGQQTHRSRSEVDLNAAQNSNASGTGRKTLLSRLVSRNEQSY